MAAGFVAPYIDMTEGSWPPFAEVGSGITYAFRETGITRTDIEPSTNQADFVAAFGRVGSTTTLQFTPSTEDWLKRVIFRFDLTFGNARSSKVLLFFSDADALSSRLRLHELAVSVAADLVPVGQSEHPIQTEVITDSFDQATLPKQICDWLGISYEQLAAITGVSRSSFFNWRQPGAHPRPGGMQRVQRLHALISQLVRRFGVSGSRKWLHSGEYPVWDRLIVGDLAAVEEAARNVRLDGARSAAQSVQVELPGPFTPEHDQEVSAYVDGQISAAELYRRTVSRYRQS
jgi:hypothetical protein